MKVRYIKEGYFNNPEQAKAKKEREAAKSSADKLASLASEAFIERLTKILADDFNSIVGGPNANTKEDMTYRKMVYDFYDIYGDTAITHPFQRGPLGLILGDVSFAFSFGWGNSDMISFSSVNFNISYNKGEDALVFDIYASPQKEGRLQGTIYTRHIVSHKTIETVFERNIKHLAQVRIAKHYTDDVEETPYYRFLLSKKIKLNKIHMFTGVDGDMMIDETIEKTANETREQNIRKYYMMCDTFSFDNSGRTIIRLVTNSGQWKWYKSISPKILEYDSLKQPLKKIVDDIFKEAMTIIATNREDSVPYSDFKEYCKNGGDLSLKEKFKLKIVFDMTEEIGAIDITNGKLESLIRERVIYGMHYIYTDDRLDVDSREVCLLGVKTGNPVGSPLSTVIYAFAPSCIANWFDCLPKWITNPDDDSKPYIPGMYRMGGGSELLSSATCDYKSSAVKTLQDFFKDKLYAQPYKLIEPEYV